MLKEMQRHCEDGSDIVFTMVVEVVELTRKDIDMSCKILAVFNLQPELEVELVETRAAGRTTSIQARAAKYRIKVLSTHLANAQLALDEL